MSMDSLIAKSKEVIYFEISFVVICQESNLFF